MNELTMIRKTTKMFDVSDKILQVAKDSGAVLFGEYTLASGLKSDHYWDGKKVALSPEGAYLVGKAILGRIQCTGVEAIGGLEMGAVPIATSVALVSFLEGTPIPAFIVRRVPKAHGTKREIEGYLPDHSKVVIVDDVITTGESIFKAIKAVEEHGCTVVKIIALVDRHEGGSELLASKGYHFESLLDFYSVDGKAKIGKSRTAETKPKTGVLC